MQIHRDIDNLPVFTNAVITVGTFDGVHSGHLKIIGQLRTEARAINGEAIIITFDPHPRMVIDPKGDPVILLNTLDEKIALLRKQDIDHLVIVPFTHEFSEISAEDYIHDFLVQKFHPHTVIIGYDHHFGKGRRGNYKLLEKFADEHQYKVKEIPEHILNEAAISSTRIRNALLQSDIETASRFLGYYYFFEAMVVKGDGIGKTIGYPTANLEITDENKLIPGDGVYVVKVRLDNTEYGGMMSIGVRPTLAVSRRVVEVNIFDLDEDLYGKTLQVHVVGYLRGQEKFNSLKELAEQISKDEVAARKKLSGTL